MIQLLSQSSVAEFHTMSQGRKAQFATTGSTPIAGQCFEDILNASVTRRTVIQSLFALPLFASGLARALGPVSMNFSGVPISSADQVIVPKGYVATPILPWGEPIRAGGPAWRGSENTPSEQEQQIGMHHDGMHFFPSSESPNTRGVLALNHEYVNRTDLFGAAASNRTGLLQTQKSLAAVGISVLEIELVNQQWKLMGNSALNRRISGSTTIDVSGPAVGYLPATMQGTTANCGANATPWGTYLSCEEDTRNRYEETQSPEHVGWVVEIDPRNPNARPIKRTAMGRMEHENAAFSVGPNNRVAFYMGNDNRFECIFKFVTARPYAPGNPQANSTLLDHGTLYVARFDAGGVGRWIALTQGKDKLTEANGFPSQGYVLAHAGKAGRTVGGTLMDRPEWITVDPRDKSVYVSLSNNARRGESGRAPVDAANPRARNVDGHIIRWMEDRNDPTAETFRWEVFALGGHATSAEANRIGSTRGDALTCPDTLQFDALGRLWIASSYPAGAIDYAAFGNSALFVCDTASRTVKRFMTGPVGCELTGFTATPDLSTVFVNVQHPGEARAGSSTWPHGNAALPPRSATVAIRRSDGGPIGS
jgi:uncharacterized protein